MMCSSHFSPQILDSCKIWAGLGFFHARTSKRCSRLETQLSTSLRLETAITRPTEIGFEISHKSKVDYIIVRNGDIGETDFFSLKSG